MRILVVGVPRSGTTLVQSLLASHSAATSFTESHFFSRHFRQLPLLSTPLLVSDPRPRIEEFLRENGLDDQAADVLIGQSGLETMGTRLRLPWRTRVVARRLLDLLDRLAASRGRAVWIEKTPQHLHYVPFLAGLSPGTPPMRFVHVIREGMDVVASLHTASQKWPRRPYAFARGPVPPYDVGTCVDRWNRDMALSLARVHSTDDHFVFYEDLMRDPEATLRATVAALGLPWEPAMIDDFARTSSGLIARDETWKTTRAELRSSSTAARALSSDQRAEVDRLLRRDLYTRLHAHAGSRVNASR